MSSWLPVFGQNLDNLNRLTMGPQAQSSFFMDLMRYFLLQPKDSSEYRQPRGWHLEFSS